MRLLLSLEVLAYALVYVETLLAKVISNEWAAIVLYCEKKVLEESPLAFVEQFENEAVVLRRETQVLGFFTADLYNAAEQQFLRFDVPFVETTQALEELKHIRHRFEALFVL